MNVKKAKLRRMKHIEQIERIMMELEKWEPGVVLSNEVTNKIGEINTFDEKEYRLEFLEESLEALKVESERDYGKKYLSEIIEEENVEFSKNNLILAPVGSGKSSFIMNKLIKDVKGKILYLVSNTTLKDSICPNDNEMRKKIGHRMYTTQNKSKFGDTAYEIHVMTYAEFGGRIEFRDDFAKEFKQIHCDEIHSLPIYREIENSLELSFAIKYLFQEHEGQQKFYFTATSESLASLEKNDVLQDVKIHNYLNHKNIKKYMTLSSYRINNLDQIRTHLRARAESYEYFGYKCLAFNKTIEGQLQIVEIAKEEGFNPIALWSVNNESKVMDDEQLRVRNELLKTGTLPEPYDFLIINSAMQEGWNLTDPNIKLAIMNTTNETEKVQALGRLRRDLDVLIYRVKSGEDTDVFINLPTKYYETDLTSELKDKLCEELNIKSTKSTIYKWTTIKKLLVKQGYSIEDKIVIIDGKRTRVSYISV